MTASARPTAADRASPAPEDAPGSIADAAPDMSADVALIQRLPAVPRILSVCLHASGMGIVAVARVTDDRWVACAVLDRMGFGLPVGGELPVDTTLCGRVRDLREPIVIEHASREAQWCDHPTPKTYNYESHVSVPIVLPDGGVWGTIVAIDPKPLPVRAPETVATFALFAELLAFQIDAERRLGEAEARLEAERRDSSLREEFIGVLAHDLRNPIAAVEAGARLLRRQAPEGAGDILDLMGEATRRMSGLVDEALDFARGRLGGGIPVAMGELDDLGPLLRQILAELKAVHPGRVIEADTGPLGPLKGDARRLGQLLSNLVGRAIEAGDGRPIRLAGGTEGGAVTLAVDYGGEPLSPEGMERLFEPFAGRQAGDRSLGLGLYIAAEIARAHGGELTAEAEPGGTRLTLTLPRTDAEPARPAA